MERLNLPEISEAGKMQAPLLKDLVFPFVGAHRSEVIIGPQVGVDVSIVQLPNGMAMALTSDPLSLIPTLGLRESAWLSVQLMANDMSTTGLAPQYAQFVLNLPKQVTRETFLAYWKYIHEFCARIGVSITGGHTGKWEGQNSTVAGGGTMIAIGEAENMITSKGARSGDVILMTKSAALAATSILALSFPNTIKRTCGTDTFEEAKELFYETSALEAGLTVGHFHRHTKSIGAMHDVTEGGVMGALYELAQASEVAMEIELDALPVHAVQKKVCDTFSIDARFCVGAGAMIITVLPERTQLLMDLLTKKGIPASIIGRVSQGKGVNVTSRAGDFVVDAPVPDEYWTAFNEAFQNGWT